jgi:hypothetical protein
MRFVVVTRDGARYSITGTPAGVVIFPTRAAARAKIAEIRPDMPSKYLPLRVREA